MTDDRTMTLTITGIWQPCPGCHRAQPAPGVVIREDEYVTIRTSGDDGYFLTPHWAGCEVGR